MNRELRFSFMFGERRRRMPRGRIESERWCRKRRGETRPWVPSDRHGSSAFAVGMLRDKKKCSFMEDPCQGGGPSQKCQQHHLMSAFGCRLAVGVNPVSTCAGVCVQCRRALETRPVELFWFLINWRRKYEYARNHPHARTHANTMHTAEFHAEVPQLALRIVHLHRPCRAD